MISLSFAVQGMKKIIVIPDVRYAIRFPETGNPFLMDALKKCLQRNPELRPTIPGMHPFIFFGFAIFI